MVFKPNDAKTIEAARRGGRTGQKHFAVASKRKLKAISKEGGRARWKAQRAKELADRKVRRYEDKIMSDYHEDI